MLIRQRDLKDVSQKDVASALSYHESSYSEIERGETNPESPAIGVISKALELPLEDIFEAAGWSYFPTTKNTEMFEVAWRRLSSGDRELVLNLMNRLSGTSEVTAKIDEAAV